MLILHNFQNNKYKNLFLFTKKIIKNINLLL